ncbi:MAG TPA: hypothetical protein VF493_17040, partial [Terriglobales bacterium]
MWACDLFGETWLVMIVEASAVAVLEGLQQVPALRLGDRRHRPVVEDKHIADACRVDARARQASAEAADARCCSQIRETSVSVSYPAATSGNYGGRRRRSTTTCRASSCGTSLRTGRPSRRLSSLRENR